MALRVWLRVEFALHLDEERPHLIGPRGAQKLFEQMNLSTEGVSTMKLQVSMAPIDSAATGTSSTSGLEAGQSEQGRMYQGRLCFTYARERVSLPFLRTHALKLICVLSGSTHLSNCRHTCQQCKPILSQSRPMYASRPLRTTRRKASLSVHGGFQGGIDHSTSSPLITLRSQAQSIPLTQKRHAICGGLF